MFAPVTVTATTAAQEHRGLASGLLNTTRQAGGALGLPADRWLRPRATPAR
jgi:hypothetical protein